MLRDKVAIVYGAGGIGGGIARAYAEAGAKLYLASRSAPKLDAIAKAIRKAGHEVETQVLDVFDQQAVDKHADAVVKSAGRLDISFNVFGVGDIQQPLMEISTDDFVAPVANAMRGQINTGRAAARHMIKQKSGVILFFGGGGPQTAPGLGGFKIALDAIEGLRHQWAMELGPKGIRVLTLKSGGTPETLGEGDDVKAITKALEESSPMKRAASLEDVGNVAVFAASDHARSITDTWLNIGYGAMVD